MDLLLILILLSSIQDLESSIRSCIFQTSVESEAYKIEVERP